MVISPKMINFLYLFQYLIMEYKLFVNFSSILFRNWMLRVEWHLLYNIVLAVKVYWLIFFILFTSNLHPKK